jgi:hypothetical protein
MNKEMLAFWGPVAAAVIGALASIITKLMERRSPDQPGKEHSASPQRRRGGLKLWSLVAMIVWALGSLVAIAYVFWLPGLENRWFPRIHRVPLIIANLTAGALLAFVILPETIRRSRRRLNTAASALQLGIEIVLFLLSLATLGNLGLNLNGWFELSPSTKLMVAGFRLFDSQRYADAMTAAGECSDGFHLAATKLEKSLAGQEIPLGKVSEEQARVIFNDGVLNDVAGCYWIQGHTQEAIAAYKKAQEYPHARVWDPKGWFWSPAEDAQDRVASLLSPSS